MKFKISRSDFFRTLSHLQGIVDKKNSLPILANILIEAQDNNLILSSTDMDISLVEQIKCNVMENGSTTINSQIIYDIVRKLDDNSDIEIISNNGKLLTLRASGSRFSLACLPKEDFPIIERENSGISVKINSQILSEFNLSKSSLLSFETNIIIWSIMNDIKYLDFINGFFTSKKDYMIEEDIYSVFKKLKLEEENFYKFVRNNLLILYT